VPQRFGAPVQTAGRSSRPHIRCAPAVTRKIGKRIKSIDMSLGAGLVKVAGKVFRIGHLGDFNDLTLMGTLSGVEMGLKLAAIPHQRRGIRRRPAISRTRPGRSERRTAPDKPINFTGSLRHFP
jgi:hypothetical protein